MSKKAENAKLNEYKDKLVIIHYSCSSIDDKYPQISSISTYDTKLKLLKPFSRENATKEDEITTLDEFFNYISKKIDNGCYLLGWNWGDKYGIDPMVNRYIQLKGKKPNINISRIYYFDFLKILSQKYNEFFGGLKVLAEFNGLDLIKFVDGKKEIELLHENDFQKLNNSTSTKVEIIHNLLLRYFNNDLQVPTLEEIFYAYRDIGSYPVFNENLNKIEQLIDVKNVNIKDETLQSVLRSLLYANVITCMETYLSDTFIRTVVKDKKFLKKYISESHKFKEKSTKNEIYAELFNEIKHSSNLTLDRFLVKKCIEDIREITFHNIKTASKLYKNVLGIDFPKDLGVIYKAVEIRHNLIHRNGKDKNDKLIAITYGDLKELIMTVKKFVKVIHQETKKLTK